jgi:hypothetical protein
VSIINDALKKTQHIRKVKKNKQPQVKAKPIPKPTVEKKPPPMILKTDFWFTWKMASLLTLTALILIAYTNYGQIKNSQLGSAFQTQSPNKAKVAFEGIFLADNNDRIALINKQSMHLGDKLNGMKIVAINQDSITLQSNKGKYVLKAGANYEL